jgi:hypothetical protein
LKVFARDGRKPAARRQPVRPTEPAESEQAPAPLAQLQRQAGNRAVTALVRPAPRPVRVQRKAGWSDASTEGEGWNAGERAVPGTAIRRVPVDGLTEGNQQSWQDDAASKQLTDESAAGRAIVAIPAGLDLRKPVDVLLHFHGYAETADRPYAGWRQRKSDHTVRDVALDQIEQQLHAAGAAQLIGVLPQGGIRSEFGSRRSPNLDGYVAEVLDRLAATGALAARPTAGRVIVSAHSGGGHLVKRALDQELAGKKGKGSMPANLGQLVLFDAINNADELATATAWVLSRLDADLAVLADAGRTADAKDAYLAASPRFRGYHTGGYGPRYRKLGASIAAWFDAHGTELGPYAGRLRGHYQVIAAKGLRHEEIVRGRRAGDRSQPGEGNLTDAVRAYYAIGRPLPSAAGGGSFFDVLVSLPSTLDSLGTVGAAALSAALTGFQDETELTDLLFAIRHPDLAGGRIPAGATALQREWLAIRRDVVRPALQAAHAKAQAAPAPAAPRPGLPQAAPPQVHPAAPAPATSPTPAAAPMAPRTGTMTPEKRAEFVKRAVEQATVATGKTAAAKQKSQRTIDRMEADFREHQTDAASWFAAIRPDASFLGVRIGASGASASPGVHEELAAVFANAEQTLVARYPGKTPAELATALGVHAIVGLRRPKNATGGRLPSMHCYGLAVDINYAGNPFVGRPRKGGNPVVAAVGRATLLLPGNAYALDALPADLPSARGGDSAKARAANADRAGQLWDHLHGASEALKAYLNLTDAELARRVAADGHGHDLGWWQAKLAEDRRVSQDSEFSDHTDPAAGGFMDLRRELVEVLVGAGLTWGGCYRTGKDIMHFDLRTGSIGGRD